MSRTGGPRAPIVLPILVLLCLAFPITVPGAERGSVNGSVADSEGRPIEGAQVSLSGEGARPVAVLTPADGTFRFPGVRPYAGYTITAEREGYRSIEYRGLRVESSRKRVVNFRLKRPAEREVVVLASRDPFPYADLVHGFINGLGIPARLIDLDAEADPAEMVRHVAAEKPNLILATGLKAGRLVRSEIRDVPSILTLISDPRRYDLQAANICFLALNPDPGAVFERLTTLLPGIRRIGILYDANLSMLLARDFRDAAEARGLGVDLHPCHGPEALRTVLRDVGGRVDALLVPDDPITLIPGAVDAISRWSLEHHLPLLAPGEEWVGRGALLSYGVPHRQIGEQARDIARAILFESRQPEDFNLSLPRWSTLAFNRTTAEALGVKIPAAAAEVP